MKLKLATARSLILEKYPSYLHPPPPPLYPSPSPPPPQLDTRNCDLHCSPFGTDSRVRIFESVRGGDGHG